MCTVSEVVSAGRFEPPVKPSGGYRPVRAGVLAAAWWAYKRKRVGIGDLRVWFAAHEAVARRCGLEKGAPGRFHLKELQRLTGMPEGRLRRSVRALEKAGLLRWSEPSLGFPDAPEELPLSAEDPAGLEAFLDRIPNRRRKVPVPRRILRFLAQGARPALVATVVGYLLRGLYLNLGRCLSGGSVKASWIAEAFGVAIRRVKEARREVVDAGWIVPVESGQRSMNRWGSRFQIDLEWSRPSPSLPVRASKLAPPPPPEPVSKLAPPLNSQNLPSGRLKDQKPASGGPAGFSIPGNPDEVVQNEPPPVSGSESGVMHSASPPPDGSESRLARWLRRGAMPLPSGTEPGAPSTSEKPDDVPATPPPVPPSPSPSTGKPELRNVVAEDLKDTGRLLTLYGQAVSRGLVTSSECDRLRVVSAAEHARAVGTVNPCGMFVRMLRSKLWSFLTQSDEDAARVRLRRHLHAPPPSSTWVPSSSPAPTVRAAPELSEDARIVREVRASLVRAGYRDHPFPAFARRYPGWTRERWDRAEAELGPAARINCLLGNRG